MGRRSCVLLVSVAVALGLCLHGHVWTTHADASAPASDHGRATICPAIAALGPGSLKRDLKTAANELADPHFGRVPMPSAASAIRAPQDERLQPAECLRLPLGCRPPPATAPVR